jgi:hypothetical protein
MSKKEPTLEDIIKGRIKQFDWQIKKEYKKAKGDKEKCPSYWKKLIFVASLDLSVSDWSCIRSGDYWEIADKMTDIERDEFTFSRIKYYLEYF